jgi:glutaminyl-peptide cyclotransferase
MKLILIYILLSLMLASCNSSENKSNPKKDKESEIKPVEQTQAKPKVELENQFDKSKTMHSINVLRKIPHSNSSFTQGLLYHNGYLYESTGQRGESAVYKIDPSNGEVIQKTEIDDAYFGEGITILNNKIYMLTWRSRTCLIFDLNTLFQEKIVTYDGEGWGITTVNGDLVMSDGTDVLKYLDNETLGVSKKIAVAQDGKPVEKLNELEYIDGEIWANIWMESIIARINPQTGQVLGNIDVSSLYDEVTMSYEMESINGIAYDEETGKIYLTGKNWKYIFEVEIAEIKN